MWGRVWQGIPKESASCTKAAPEVSEDTVLVLTFLLCLQSTLKKARPLGLAATGTCAWSHLYSGPGILHFGGSAPHPVVINHTHCGCSLSPVGISHVVS